MAVNARQFSLVCLYSAVSGLGCSRSVDVEAQGRLTAPLGNDPTRARVEPTDTVVPTRGRTRVAAGTQSPVALVELFTSEGCSSCPSADRVLSRIEDWREQSGSNVITLAFHVDYWNRLGWRDRFSDRVYSDRQRWYAMHKPEPRVYTPQMIVQGTGEFIGSHEAEIRRAIGGALDQPMKVNLRLEATPLEQGAWEVHYQVEPARAADHLSLALVQHLATTEVAAGENAGETLTHVNVVLDYANKHVDGGRGSWRVQPPRGEVTTAVLFVQDPTDLSVVGANRLAL